MTIVAFAAVLFNEIKKPRKRRRRRKIKRSRRENEDT
jgi:hypothetical protein